MSADTVYLYDWHPVIGAREALLAKPNLFNKVVLT
jgi:hypothetical protein